VKLGAVCGSDSVPSWIYSVSGTTQTISKATTDVQAFAKEIVHWVGEVKSAFEHGNGGRFTSKTRKNLMEMRYA